MSELESKGGQDLPIERRSRNLNAADSCGVQGDHLTRAQHRGVRDTIFVQRADQHDELCLFLSAGVQAREELSRQLATHERRHRLIV